MKNLPRIGFLALLAGILLTLSACFPVYGPPGYYRGYGYRPHHHHHDYYGGGYRDYDRGWDRGDWGRHGGWRRDD